MKYGTNDTSNFWIDRFMWYWSWSFVEDGGWKITDINYELLDLYIKTKKGETLRYLRFKSPSLILTPLFILSIRLCFDIFFGFISFVFFILLVPYKLVKLYFLLRNKHNVSYEEAIDLLENFYIFNKLNKIKRYGLNIDKNLISEINEVLWTKQ